MAACWVGAAVLLALWGAAASVQRHPLHHPSREGLNASVEWSQDSLKDSAHCSLPSTLSLDLLVGDRTLPLVLSRHLHLASSIPRYRTEARSRLSYTLPGVEDDVKAIYSSRQDGVTLLVTCRAQAGSRVLLRASGMVTFNEELHHLEPLSSDRRDLDLAQTYRLHPNLAPQVVQYAPGPGSPGGRDMGARERRRRALSDLQDKHIILDFITVGEYHLYDKFLGWAAGSSAQEKRQNAVKDIEDYMALNLAAAANVYVGVDLDLNVNIDIRLQAFVVMESLDDQPEFNAATDLAQNTSDADQLLAALKAWMVNRTQAGSLPSTDGVILFTGLDVARGGNSGVAGIATTPSICENYGTALVEFEQYHTYFHVAHEIGHMLSAAHDKADCVGGAMMSGMVSTSKSLTDWRFSNCSIASFKSHLANIYSAKSNCLLGTFAASPSVTNYTRYPGAYVEMDRQCQLIHGHSAIFCRDCIPKDLTPENVCTNNQLPCRVGGRNILNAGFPLPGTPCGSGKWCYEGQCVASDIAPARDETCLYGEQTVERDWIGTGPMNCSEYISGDPGTRCKADSSSCCQVCKQYETGVGPDCKYVQPNVCGSMPEFECGASTDLGGPTVDELCCWQCIYNFTVPPQNSSTSTTVTSVASTSTTVTSVASTSTTVTSVASISRETTQAATTQAATISTTSTTSTTDSCRDTTETVQGYQTCAGIVKESLHYCYNSSLFDLCCQSCQLSSRSDRNCRYGDRDPARCQQDQEQPCPESLAQTCCESCSTGSAPCALRSPPCLLLLLLASLPVLAV